MKLKPLSDRVCSTCGVGRIVRATKPDEDKMYELRYSCLCRGQGPLEPGAWEPFPAEPVPTEPIPAHEPGAAMAEAIVTYAGELERKLIESEKKRDELAALVDVLQRHDPGQHGSHNSHASFARECVMLRTALLHVEGIARRAQAELRGAGAVDLERCGGAFGSIEAIAGAAVR